MTNFWNAAVLSAALIIPAALAPVALRAEDHRVQVRTYHDRNHNDDHEWNNHEDRAYGIYMKDNHRKNRAFVKLNANDQQSYWGWRHEHSDAVLKIDIR